MHKLLPDSIRRVLLPGILVLSIFLNVLFFMYGKRFYVEQAHVRLDPLGLNYFPLDNGELASNEQFTVVFYGDSRVVDWLPPPLEDAVMINRGVHSQTTAQVAHRYGAHVTPLQPDVVVLQVGVNDLKTLAVFPGRRPRLVAQCIENITRIIDTANSQSARVIVTTIFPVGHAPLHKKPFWPREIAVAVEEVNHAIRKMHGDNVTVFDAWALLADDDGLLRAEFAPDELHLNVAGYTELNGHLRTLLEEAIRRPVAEQHSRVLQQFVF